MSIVETPRLHLRPYTVGDIDALHGLLSDPVTMQFWPTPFTREQSGQWLERNSQGFAEDGGGRLALILRGTGAMIGDCGIMCAEIDGTLENDLGYIVHAAHWGRGYATEAASALTAYGFETLGLTRLCASMPIKHRASRRVAEKIGMTLEREFDNPRNRGIRTCLYSTAFGAAFTTVHFLGPVRSRQAC